MGPVSDAVAKKWGQPTWARMGEQISKRWARHRVEYYSAKNNDKAPPLATAVTYDDMMPRKASPTQGPLTVRSHLPERSRIGRARDRGRPWGVGAHAYRAASFRGDGMSWN